MRIRTLARSAFAFFLALSVVSAPAVAASKRTSAVTAPPARPSVSGYHDEWRKLLEDHITWTRMVIFGVFKDLPCTNAYAARLLQNPGDMADALRPFYGDEAADRFRGLVTDHLTIAVELLTAAKTGNTPAFEDAHARWYANGDDIAELMAELNPLGWPEQEAEEMWEEHLDATLAEAVAVLTNDCTGDVAGYDTVHDLALEMADFFSDGVIRQFPGRFSRSNPPR